MDTDVLVIGGGATGAGAAWDLALRGVRVILAEMDDLTTGTSGRYHGLLHSGGRYVVRDPESARECIEENLILRRIARPAIEDTGGLFILCPGDDETYVDPWLAACKKAGISTQEISPAAALRREPALNLRLTRAFEVPDASCDSFDLGHMLQKGAREAGAEFLTYHRVDEFHRTGNRITGARLTNLRDGQPVDVTCAVAVNATGPWAAKVAEKAGIHIRMELSRGAMLAFNVRWVNTVINKLRPPGDGDIFVPVGTVSVTGTTSVHTDDPGDTLVEAWEVQHILKESEAMTPGISRARILRSWAGVRPLYDPRAAAEGREAVRTLSVLDHEALDDVAGLVTITGGKLTTFRLMAEKTANLVCRKLNVTTPCRTASTPLPVVHDRVSFHHHLSGRLDQLEHGQTPGALICECELVTAPQIEEALGKSDVVSLNDLRRELRLGMGPCQGGFCSYRAASLRHELRHDTPDHTRALLAEFVERRFGGVKPLLWGHNLRQALLAEHIYGRILGLTPPPTPPRLQGGELRTGSIALIPKDKTIAKRVIIVGAGLAGLTSALTALEFGAQVELVAQGQGALTLYPGWIEVGFAGALSQDANHPYYRSRPMVGIGVGILRKALDVKQGPFDAVTAMGTLRRVDYSAGGSLMSLTPGQKIAVVGIQGWRDFYAGLIADTLCAAGFDAHAMTITLSRREGHFDDWPVDIARLLDTPEGMQSLIAQVRGRLDGATAVGFPAVLGFEPETRQRLAESLGCPIFEIPTLPPSIPGLRLYHALRKALLDKGARFTIGPRVAGLAMKQGRVSGVQIETANGRLRTIYGDAVILCTGGLYGGGLDSDYLGSVREVVAGLSVVNAPLLADWFTQPFLSGEAQPVHRIGVATDKRLRPLNADGAPFAPNLFAAGRLLAGYSPVVEGSAEGVDIATGAHVAGQAVIEASERAKIG